MKRRALRFLLGAGYVVLLTLLLLYQAGVFGDRRDWGVTTFATLFLGASLAVVLSLYIRVNDRIRGQEAVTGSESDVTQKSSAGQNSSIERRSYEEIYACFLATMERYTLSERELEVAWLLYRGYTNRQIGEELYIAETTVKKHVSHIYQKLEVGSRKEFRARVQATSVPRQTAPPS